MMMTALKNNSELLLKKSGLAKLEQRIPYLKSDDFFEPLPSEGTIISFYDSKNKLYFGYVGKEQQSHVGIIDEPFTLENLTFKIKKALEKRKKAFGNLPQAFRLIHNEADDIPGLTIEIFQTFAVITYYNLGIIAFESLIIQALLKVLPVEGIYAKYRIINFSIDKIKLLWGQKAPPKIVIEETSGKFIVKLEQGLMNGLFLDQRANRIWLQSISKNKTVCNTFSYTGALSIACALGGAKSTTSVDLSKTYCEWCLENIYLNKLDINRHQVITNDTFAHFDFCRRKGIKYDIIILDPPSFAKKKGGSFSVAMNYKDLILASLSLLNESGLLVCSSNFSLWSLEEFNQIIQNITKKHGYKLKLNHQAQADKDFPVHPDWLASNHLKFIVLLKTKG